MTTESIQAVGYLLSTYHSDLTYIRNFQQYKNGAVSTQLYWQKSNGTFKSFIDEYRVARNVDKSKTEMLLGLTTHWVSTADANDVDLFAAHLCERGITHGKTMTSLASKILMLNNPWKIFPIDSLSKKAVGLNSNLYEDFLPLVTSFENNYGTEITALLNSVDDHLTIIETKFQQDIPDLKVIRRNRLVDKLLWTKGRKLE